jgi:ABC-type nitrate/sulfonate/bicarbonate transport system substrate-binding protein
LHKIAIRLHVPFLAALLALCVSMLPGCGKPTDDGTGARAGFYPGTVKIGHLVALDMAPMFVAKEAGFFKEEGIDVETIFFPNPGDNNAAIPRGEQWHSHTDHFLCRRSEHHGGGGPG